MESLLEQSRLLMPLQVPDGRPETESAQAGEPKAEAATAVEGVEDPGLMDRPIVATVEGVALKAMAPARALIERARHAWDRLRAIPAPVAALVGLLAVWALAKALGTLVQLAAVALVAYAALAAMRHR